MKDLIRYAVALLLLSIPLFYNLGELPIRVWDESRLAINALEMFSNNNFLVVHFDGKPEMWSTKPQLMIWLQTASIHLFGLSEFSIRLPSAIAALLTSFILLLIGHRYLKNFWLGILAAFILVTNVYYNGHHVARTGDYDALLILFLTAASYCLFLYSDFARTRYLFGSFLFFGLAIATKGVAAILIVPGLVLYLFLKGQFQPLFRKPVFYLGTILILLIILALYGGREMYNPGYLQAVFENEIGGRYFEVNEGHHGGPFYYVRILFSEYWMYFFPIALLAFRQDRKSRNWQIMQFSMIVFLCFLIFVSVAKTKLFWYIAPAYPFIALMLAIGFFHLLDRARERMGAHRQFSWAVCLGFLAISVFPVIQVIDKVYAPRVYQYEVWQYEMAYYLRDAHRSGDDLSEYKFMRKQYQPHIDFYVSLMVHSGSTISFGHSDQLKIGDKIIFWENEVGELLSEIAEVNAIDAENHKGQVRRLEIVSLK